MTYPTIESLSEIHCARCNYDMWKAEEVSSRAFWSSTTIRRGTVTGTNEKKSFKKQNTIKLRGCRRSKLIVPEKFGLFRH